MKRHVERNTADDDFRGFYERLEPRAVATAVRLVGNRSTAEDIVAEAFARAYAKWSKVSGHPNPDAWLLRVVGNVAIDHIRRETRRPQGDLHQPRIDPSANDAVLRIDLTEAMSRLSARQREIVMLRYLVDMPEEEVAASLGISTGSVKTHLHRATTKLRSQLGPHDILLPELEQTHG